MDARGDRGPVYRQSGLLGVSGISSDMRTLRALDRPEGGGGNRAVRLSHRARDRLPGRGAGRTRRAVFTAGIGENDPATRADVMDGCAWLGLEPDAARNEAGAGRISAERSRGLRLGSSDRRGADDRTAHDGRAEQSRNRTRRMIAPTAAVLAVRRLWRVVRHSPWRVMGVASSKPDTGLVAIGFGRTHVVSAFARYPSGDGLLVAAATDGPP